jgi:hypothetical protein
MKYLIALGVVLSALVTCYAGRPFSSSSGAIYNVTLSSAMSTNPYTPLGGEKYYIDNRTGFTVYMSTWQINGSTNAAVTGISSAYPIFSSTDPTKPLLSPNSSAFDFFILAPGTATITNGFWFLIDR